MDRTGPFWISALWRSDRPLRIGIRALLCDLMIPLDLDSDLNDELLMIRRVVPGAARSLFIGINADASFTNLSSLFGFRSDCSQRGVTVAPCHSLSWDSRSS